MSFTPSRKLEIQFTKSIRRGYVRNVELHPDMSESFIALDAGETCVAKVQSKSDESYYFTDSRILLSSGRKFQSIPYEDIRSYDWITDSSDIREKVKLKTTHYDRLILEKKNGEKVTLEGLDQAAFSLFSFLNWILGERKDEVSVESK